MWLHSIIFLFCRTIDLIGNVTEIKDLGERLIPGTAGSYLWSREPIACSGELVACCVVDKEFLLFCVGGV
jgi:hypothetical protein